jgi:protein-S-isoprenylcysteine O-methyltransferase Ste14
MDQALRLLLPLYFILYFGIAFVAKSVVVARKIGKSPLVLPKDDSAYGLIGRYFKWTLMAMFVYVMFFSLRPDYFASYLNFNSLFSEWAKVAGLALLAFALLWTIMAQNHMRNSWRIGIDTETKTELITTGLFQYSRNPVFLGMIICLIGLFMVTPNTITLLFLLLGYVLIQVQIRLEEDFLTQQHGQAYLKYKQKVRRII